jgi:GntR family transcriptional repressor for pyruvate dehydrogenase complex
MSTLDTELSGRKRTTAELVVDVVRSQIERGLLRRGQRLPPERELAARLGVSRPTVRSGLRTLATMGILRTRHGSGTYVTDGPPRLDVRPLRLLGALHGFQRVHVDEARRVLEVTVAGLAAGRASGHQLASMAEHVSGLFASIENATAFAVHETAFHRAMAGAGGNPILASIVEMVGRLTGEQSRSASGRSAEELRAVALAYRNIYQAIRSRDGDRARHEMRQHSLRMHTRRPSPRQAAGAASTALS